ncbi:hypothetical protein NMH_1725 [Neisseria meningitidis H44/76]|uniref:Uncharacterized protein n=1 Tax=Neisseria meningitidis serogroup B / serotype 15 (strain H44/76) TaxID=909420 RepID=E6MZ53_NEIMH|nr:hypothetical protein NMH_1725 [Neisseria meningitidis H44/76]
MGRILPVLKDDCLSRRNAACPETSDRSRQAGSDFGVAGIVAGIKAMLSERGMTFRRHRLLRIRTGC